MKLRISRLLCLMAALMLLLGTVSVAYAAEAVATFDLTVPCPDGTNMSDGTPLKSSGGDITFNCYRSPVHTGALLGNTYGTDYPCADFTITCKPGQKITKIVLVGNADADKRKISSSVGTPALSGDKTTVTLDGIEETGVIFTYPNETKGNYISFDSAAIYYTKPDVSTGDATNAALYCALLVASAAAIAVILRGRRCRS